MRRFALPLTLTLVLAAGCGGETPEAPVTESPPPTSVTETAREPAVAPDSGEALADARIVPDWATCRSELALEADPTFLSGCQVRWMVNGMEIDGANGRTFSSIELKKGDVIRAVISKDGQETYTQDVLIGNTPPMIVSAHIEPRQPSGTDRMYVEVNGRDLDGDTVTYGYKWSINGVPMGDADYLQGGIKRDDQIAVEVVPYDGTDAGSPVVLEAIAVNTLPVVVDGTAEFDSQTYRYRISASDPDGDALQYTLVSGPEGMEVNPTDGTVTWAVPENKVGTNRVEVDVTDGNGGRVRYAWDVAIQWEEDK